MSKQTCVEIVMMLMVACATGCGGGELSLGLPRDKQLKDLTLEDWQQSCRVSQAALKMTDAAVRGACASSLSSLGADQCNESLQGCFESTKKQIDAAQGVVCSELTLLPAQQSCVATAGDLEDCYTAIFSAIHNMEGATCALSELFDRHAHRAVRHRWTSRNIS